MGIIGRGATRSVKSIQGTSHRDQPGVTADRPAAWRHLALLGVALVALSAGRAAHAQQASNWYVGLAPAAPNFHLDPAILGEPLLSPSVATALAQSSDHGVRLKLGHRLDDTFSLEGSYSDYARVDARPSTWTAVGSDANGDVRMSGWNASLLGSTELLHGMRGFGKLAVLYSGTRTGNPMTGAGFDSDERHRVLPGFGFGAETALTDSTMFRLQYERYYRLGEGQVTNQGYSDLLSVGLRLQFQ